MDGIILGVLGLVLLLVFIFMGMNLALSFFIIGFFGIWLIKGWAVASTTIQSIPFLSFDSYSWSVIPLFIFMGIIVFEARIGGDIFHAVRLWMGHFAGGIAAATSGACALIGTMTGSGAATAALMAKVAYPEMVKYNYDKTFSLQTCAASSTAAMMVPPSVAIVVYAILAQVSIGKALLGGFIPGFMSMGIYMIMIFLRVRANPKLGPKLSAAPWKDRITSLRFLVPAGVMIMAITGGIYFGVFTATEAGGMGSFVAFMTALSMRRLSWARIRSAFSQTLQFTVMVMMIIFTITGYYTHFLNISGITGAVADLAVSFPSPWITLILIFAVTFIFGMFIGTTLAYVTIPLFAPIVAGMGFDLVWFVIVMIKMAETGSITPPVCLALFIAQGIVKEVDMASVFKTIWWFVGCDMLTLALMIAVPQIILFLPNSMS